MLENLHVKNLALIDEQEITFTRGLNILTGETGAGKSIVLGSIHLALGAKADKDSIRSGADYALIELVFSLNDIQKKQMEEMEIPLEEDGTLLLQRKIMPGKSICRINGETVSVSQLKELSGCLMDMYGQHEHQTLLKPLVYGRMLDQYIGSKALECKEALKEELRQYQELKQQLDEQDMDEEMRKRQADLLSFEVNEIEAASLQKGEDEELEKQYQKLVHAMRIQEAVTGAYAMTGYEEEESAGNVLGRAMRELKSVQKLDEELDVLGGQLTEIDSLLNDFNRALSEYSDSLNFEEEEFAAVEERLNLINHLKSKYGNTVADILTSYEQKQEKLEQLGNYELYLEQLKKQIEDKKQHILEICKTLSGLRKEAAEPLSRKLKAAMIDLNFIDVQFDIEVTSDPDHFHADGYDKIEFLISVNPGEAMRPIWQVASGGELSRIMLAFKTVFADKEDTATLIFDEIDTGISGKTAWKVSEKMGQLSRDKQIICITHLPQIAAMADTHFLIEKSVKENRTVTDLTKLSEEGSLRELARLLGSEEVSEAAISNAKEMKITAQKAKEQTT